MFSQRNNPYCELLSNVNIDKLNTKLKNIMKNILGLDLGTNSIGWALVEQDFAKKEGKILGMGSRIIPMTQDIKDEFGKGNSISQTADRTRFRGVRRLRERHLLRRERLHRVLHVLDFLPEHYAKEIDFQSRFGQFVEEAEPKIAWKKNGDEKFEFLFQNTFQEMAEDFKANGQSTKIPYDWTIYYLRNKALSQKIEKEELAWIILSFNQKRGYYQLRGEEEEENPNKLVEFHSLKITDVVADEKPNHKGETWYSLQLENGWVYRRSSIGKIKSGISSLQRTWMLMEP
jgi:CRISPR-associated endonuclease Csn1